jgi:hypothetical protein
MTELLPQLVLMGITGLLSFVGAFAGVRVRLKLAEHSAARAHSRLDDHLHDHITGAI